MQRPGPGTEKADTLSWTYGDPAYWRICVIGLQWINTYIHVGSYWRSQYVGYVRRGLLPPQTAIDIYGVITNFHLSQNNAKYMAQTCQHMHWYSI